MKVRAYRDDTRNEIYCIVTFDKVSYIEEDILLNEEYVRSVAFEKAKTEKEEDIVLYSDLVIVPRVDGGFYVNFKGFVE